MTEDSQPATSNHSSTDFHSSSFPSDIDNTSTTSTSSSNSSSNNSPRCLSPDNYPQPHHLDFAPHHSTSVAEDHEGGCDDDEDSSIINSLNADCSNPHRSCSDSKVSLIKLSQIRSAFANRGSNLGSPGTIAQMFALKKRLKAEAMNGAFVHLGVDADHTPPTPTAGSDPVLPSAMSIKQEPMDEEDVVSENPLSLSSTHKDEKVSVLFLSPVVMLKFTLVILCFFTLREECFSYIWYLFV